MSCSSISSVDTTYNSGTDSDWDSEEDSSSDSDISNYFFLSNPLSEKLKLPLTENEKNLIDEFYKKMEEISEQDDQAYNQNENYTENALRNIDHLVSEYLEKGIRLNSYPDSKNNTTIADLVFFIIEGIAGNAMNNVKGGYSESKGYRYSGGDGINKEAVCLGDRIMEGDCINTMENIVIKVLLNGGKTILKTPFQYEGLGHIEYNFECNLVDKCRKINIKLKNVAYKSVINKNKGDFEVAIDNGYFFIEYEKGSIVELTKVTNNQIIDDLNSEYKLNLRIGILQIGKSIVKVEKLGEKRNYTDVPEGSIKMSFTTEIEGKTEKISILLHSDKEDNSKIRVELNEENQKKFDKLKNKSSLGKNCLLGGKNILQAIQDQEFTKHESYKTATLSTLLKQISVSNIFDNLKNGFEQFGKYVLSV